MAEDDEPEISLAQQTLNASADVAEAAGAFAGDTIDLASEQIGAERDALNALYLDKYKNFFLQYPANVDNAVEERHWIRFDVQEIKGQTLETPDTKDDDKLKEPFDSKFGGAFGKAIESGVERAVGGVKSAINVPGQLITRTANEFLNEIPVAGGLAKQFLSGSNESKARGLGSILLYAPFSRTDTAGFQWQTNQSTGFIGQKFSSGVKGISKTVRDVANASASALRGDAAAQGSFAAAVGTYGALFGADEISKATGGFAPKVRDQLLKSEGVAFNNHVESFFSDVQMRSFEFTFQLSPRTPSEAREIQQIIKMFKYAGHPAQYEGLSGVFFAYPQVFDIEIYNQDQTHKIGTSALTGMSTTYGGDTRNNTFYDNHPVQVNLSLRFTELEILDKDKVDKGF